MWEAAPVRVLEGRFFDRMQRLYTGGEPAPVALVAIDAESLAVKGDWPWPRAVVAGMIEYLNDSDARLIGLYPLFAAREPNPGLEEIRNLRREIDGFPLDDVAYFDEILHRIEERSDGDRRLALALDRAPRAVLPLRFSFSDQYTGKGPGSHDSAPLARRNSLAWELNSHNWQTANWQTALQMLANPLAGGREKIPAASGAVAPLSELIVRDSWLGHINRVPDPDGRIRFEHLMTRLGDRLYPSFALQMAAAWHDIPPVDWQLNEGEDGVAKIFLGSAQIPVDRGFRLPISYGRSDKGFTRYSFNRVAQGQVPVENFHDQAVLIGVTAPEAASVYATPLGEKLSGVEIAAHTMVDLMSPQQLSRPGWTFYVELVFMLQLGIFLALVIPRVRPLPGLLLMTGFLALWFGLAAGLLVTNGFWLKTAAPTLLVVAGLAMIHLRQLITGSPRDYEDLKLLGLSLQGQGMLDLALDKFRKCPVTDPSVRELLYNLGLDFERKRMFNKAEAVYAHILKGGKFRDTKQRLANLKSGDQTVVLGGGGAGRAAPAENSTRPTLGRYEIVREIGHGAMGIVYLGNDPTINRQVAIKTLQYESIDPNVLEDVKSRFFREAKAAGKLNHPNIVTIFDAGEEHDMAYFAMEYLDGTDLSAYCREDNLLPVARVLELAAQIADALDYAHVNEVVHRDVKPANIMLMANGSIKMTDFGIARLLLNTSHTQTGMLLGTPNYMSPEQVAGKQVDGRSDLFSLGIVMYELLTGSKPFQGDSIASLTYNITKGNHIPLDKAAPEKLPACCLEIVEKLLAKAPSRRFRSAGQSAKKMRQCLEEIG